MKKHIQKKCLTTFELTKNVTWIKQTKVSDSVTDPENKLTPEEANALIVMDTSQAVIAFPFNDNGRIIHIPEPNPILIYFDSAYNNFRQLVFQKKTLLDHLKSEKLDEYYLIDLYAFYGSVNSFVILLFTAIEAFINYNIPKDFQYIVKEKKKTETYDKSQIMYLPFTTKIGPVLKEVFGTDFRISHVPEYQHVTNLKEIRDAIVHLKPGDTTTPYAYIFKKCLTFKFEETLDAVMDFLNFYKPGLINYCPCDKDF